jgi:pimeloyl-ACP methyl ester carboxylesterase
MPAFEGVKGLRASSLQVGPVPVRYYDSGVGHGRSGNPIVLLHGTGGSAEADFWALLPMLAFRQRIIALDYSNPHASEPPDLPSFVAQCEAVIRSVSPSEPVILVGYSLGAAVATATAAVAPELVAGLVTLGGWLKTDNEQRLRNDLWLSLYDQGDFGQLSRYLVFTGYGAPYLAKRSQEEIDDLVAAGAARLAQTAGWRAQMQLNRHLDISEDAYATSTPTLVIGFRHDKVAPLHHSRLLFGAIEDARYVEVSAGHAGPAERPAELYWLIEQFGRDPRRLPAGSVIDSAPLRVFTADGSVGVSVPAPGSRRTLECV